MGVIVVVMAVTMVVLMMNTHLDAQTSSSIDSSASAAQILVEFNGVDAGGSGGGKSV